MIALASRMRTQATNRGRLQQRSTHEWDRDALDCDARVKQNCNGQVRAHRCGTLTLNYAGDHCDAVAFDARRQACGGGDAGEA